MELQAKAKRREDKGMRGEGRHIKGMRGTGKGARRDKRDKGAGDTTGQRGPTTRGMEQEGQEVRHSRDQKRFQEANE